MKARRKNSATKSKRKNTAEEHRWRPNLPYDVLIQILCRLPIKTLISFKSVSKSWLNLISADNHLANLHHQRAPTELLLRSSKNLYFGNIQFHNDPFSSDSKLNVSERSNCTNDSVSHVMPDFRFGYLDAKVDDSLFANSCNGFVCFHKRSNYSKLMDAMICNPVTGEFITIPSPESDHYTPYFHAYGLGFSGNENRYKLLRLLYTYNGGNSLDRRVVAQICTFEKGSSWRNLGDCPFSYGTNRCVSPLAFLEGKLHFNCNDSSDIDWFDFDDERFGEVALPPLCDLDDDSAFCKITGKMKLTGELRSCLSVFHYKVTTNCFDVWVMKKYGVADSWEKLFSLNGSRSVHCFLPRCCLMQMGNGKILLWTREKRLVLCNQVLTNARSVRLDCAFLEVIAYSPTLVPLKEALAGYEACVQNLDSM